MNKISKLTVFMLLHGLMILSPPTGGTHMVQAYDTADLQAVLETTSSRNWNFPRKLKVEKLKEVNVEPQRIGTPKPPSPKLNLAPHPRRGGAITLFFGGFGPGARTCYAVRYISKMEHSRMGLQLVKPEFERRRIPIYAPVANRMRSQGAPPRLNLYINSEMNKISKLIVLMLLHGLMILSPPTGGTPMVQADNTADRQAALETTASRNWNFPRKLKEAYPLEKLKGMKNERFSFWYVLIMILAVLFQIYKPSTGIKIMLALDSDSQSGTVKIAYTRHFSAEVTVEPQRIRRHKPSSPNRNPARHEGFKFPPPPMLRVRKRVGLNLYINSEMSKISKLIVFMLLHGLMILSPPTGGTHNMVQAYDTADRQTVLETTSSWNWNFPRKLNVEKLKGITVMLALDSDRQSGTVKIASTKHFSAEVNMEPQRIRRPKPPSPKPNLFHHYGAPPSHPGLQRIGLNLYINSQMNKISKLIVFMLLHGLMILSPPTGGTHMVQAYDTADRQAALETASSRNWNFPRKLSVQKLKVAMVDYQNESFSFWYILIMILAVLLQIYEPSIGIKIMLALDSDRHSGTVKIAYTKHFSAEVNVEPQRLGRLKPPSPKPNRFHNYVVPPSFGCNEINFAYNCHCIDNLSNFQYILSLIPYQKDYTSLVGGNHSIS
ncbi:hypothetical protein SADUNF_Sadunf13G0037300 [Salix dunnii]|uniref:Uncharacterized protein n=1 Tax=Salix dunnii TaxID=1413687 RepID=A0A835JH43_9ROSI|nr:hypothetical protein SADUNF_Sadunf13G0037300 [Salix dunnii]